MLITKIYQSEEQIFDSMFTGPKSSDRWNLTLKELSASEVNQILKFLHKSKLPSIE